MKTPDLVRQINRIYKFIGVKQTAQRPHSWESPFSVEGNYKSLCYKVNSQKHAIKIEM